MVAQNQVRSYPDAPPGVFEKDPIYAPWSESGTRLPVLRPLKGVEGVRACSVLVAGGEVCVQETRPHQAAVHGRAGAAVEVPRDDYGLLVLAKLRQLAEDQAAALDAGDPTSGF